MKKNDKIKLKIEDVTKEGHGIGRHDGMAIFIPGAATGDELEVLVLKVLKNYAFGKILNIITPSTDRVTPDCEVFSQCGGCAFRHINYEAELRIKTKFVIDAIERIGKINTQINPIIGADEIDFYRNKAQYPVGKNAETGFYALHSHRIIDCIDCRLSPPEFEKILQIFKKFIQQTNLTSHEKYGLLRHIYIRKAMNTGEIMVCPVINGQKLPRADMLINMLSVIPSIKSIMLNINTKDTNVILGEKFIHLQGEPHITDILCGIKFRLSPKSFYQVNTAMTEVLYNLVKTHCECDKNMTIVDLYCGTGTIGLTLAKDVKQLIGVEIVKEAIKDAEHNKKINNINNTRFINADAAEAAKQLETEGIKPDIIIIDPPRKGCDDNLIEPITKMNPKKIIYISCNPATLARDLSRFEALSYKTTEITPIDLFPRTAHVETVVLLSHKKPDSYININIEFGKGEGKIPLEGIAQRIEDKKPKKRITYKMIKEYILEKHGFKVHTANIAEVKRSLGLPMYEAPNKVDELKNPYVPATPIKVEAIKDALKHFEII